MKTSTQLIGVLTVVVASLGFTTQAGEPDRARAAIESQARALNEATKRGDAAAIASLFTADAKLGVPGTNGIVSGRPAIQRFWQAALGSGMGALSLAIGELEGSGDLRVDTGRFSAHGANGVELGTGDYLIVWKNESGTWKIHRDYAPPGAPAAQAGAVRGTSAAGSATGPDTSFPFPANYPALNALGVAFNEGSSEITATFANAPAVSVEKLAQLPYPDGAIFVMEFASVQRDGEGQVMRDPAGKPLKGEILHVDVMRKGGGSAKTTAAVHAGDWEFASFRADGGVAVSPANAGHCAECHQKAGAEKDFVFRQRAPLSR